MEPSKFCKSVHFKSAVAYLFSIGRIRYAPTGQKGHEPISYNNLYNLHNTPPALTSQPTYPSHSSNILP